MKWDHVKRNWASVSAEIKRTWGKFTDEDLLLISGQRESLVRLFALRYSSNQEAAEAKVDAFVLGLEPYPKKKHSFSFPGRWWTNISRYIHVPNRRT